MFESVSIARQDYSIQRLVEGMLYFDRVQIVVAFGNLKSLIDSIGYDNLVRAIESGHLSVQYDGKIPSSLNVGEKSVQVQLVTLHAWKDCSPFASPHDQFVRHFLQWYGITKENRRRAEHLCSIVQFRDQNQVALERTISDLTNPDITTALFREMVHKKGLRSEFSYFRFHRDGDTLNGETDCAMACPNGENSNGLSAGDLAANLFATNVEVLHGADGKTDIWLDEQQENSLRIIFQSISRQAGKSRRDIEMFEDIQFHRRSFGDVIERGDRSFSEFLNFLESPETQKFKKWLQSVKPEGRFISEYDKYIFSSHGLSESKNFKLGKLALAVGGDLYFSSIVDSLGLADGIKVAANVVGTLAGETVGAAVDKVAGKFGKPWLPNAWVAGPADKFLGEE